MQQYTDNLPELFIINEIDPIEAAKQVLSDAGYYIQNLWSKSDIILCLENDGIEWRPTPDELQKIHEKILEKEGEGAGIDFDLIYSCILSSFGGKPPWEQEGVLNVSKEEHSNGILHHVDGFYVTNEDTKKNPNFHVWVPKLTHAVCDSAYNDLSLAVARCNYLAKHRKTV